MADSFHQTPATLRELTIRPARPGERRLLEDLQRRASLQWEEYRDALLAHPDAIALPGEHILEGRVYVAERDGEVLGFTVVLPRCDRQAELDGLFVEPAVWRTGIGTQLVRRAERLALHEGAIYLYVTASPRVQDFYATCGFEQIGNEQTRFGIGRRMRKSL